MRIQVLIQQMLVLILTLIQLQKLNEEFRTVNLKSADGFAIRRDKSCKGGKKTIIDLSPFVGRVKVAAGILFGLIVFFNSTKSCY